MTGSFDDSAVKLARLLLWQRDMGADAAVATEAINWLARGDAAPGAGFKMPAPTAAAVAKPAEANAALSPHARPVSEIRPVERVIRPKTPLSEPEGKRATATPGRPGGRPQSAAPTLEALRGEIERFDGCGLKATAKSLCFYRGAPTARLMIIGEAPGRDEDLAGKPFVGRAGQLLDRMLAAIGLGEADVHITNTVYWRPPGNRQPTPQEMLACRPFLERQIDLVSPRIIVLMGGVAASHMLDTTTGITKLRGKWTTLERAGGPVRTLPTLHPAYLLRSPAAKRQAWHDLRLVKAALEAL
jgi:DNA polymerase